MSDTLSTPVSPRDKQLQREAEAVSGGIVRYRRNTLSLRHQGAESITPPGVKLLVAVIEPVAKAIAEFVETSAGRRGPKHHALQYLELFPADLIAFITMRSLVDGMTRPHRTITSVALDIAGRLRDEVRFSSFEAEQPRLFRAVQANLKKHPQGKNPRVRRSMLTHTILKNSLALVDWPKADRLHLGTSLVELAVSTTGLFSIEKIFRNHREYITVQPTEQLLQWVKECDARLELMSPLRQPMVCPPNDWTTPHDGGYLTPRLQTKLVRGRRSRFLKELELRDIRPVYKAINTLQRTAWKINAPMLTLLEEIEQAGMELEGWPSTYPVPAVPRPDNYSTMPVEARKSWKMKAAEAFRQEERRRSLRVHVVRVLEVAKSLRDESAIYFPHFLDFRGRMYPLPQDLNPQGTDLAKSLLTFAEGQRLGQSGVRWLKIHLANCWGIDKVTMEERVRWTEENSDRIVATANDPLANKFWTEADKPFQALAAACEWIMVQEEGEDYVCSLPVCVDGSNNGLQHLSAMLRDSACGSLVNLVPSDRPADVYQSVADAVVASLRAYLSDSGNIPDEERSIAAKWLDYGITRSLMKRPVMILPYGGSVAAMRRYIAEAVLNNRDVPNPFGREFGKAVNFLAGRTWATMDGLLIGPQLAMRWMRDVGKAFVKSNGRALVPLNWTTPTGFLVQQCYLNTTSRRVKTKLGDQLIYLSLWEETDTIDARKSGTALSPNFVHSMDAAALAMTIGRCRDTGILAFSAVHDSYGTHAAHMDELFSELREAFVEMYSVDRLSLLREELQAGMAPVDVLAPVPAKGDLDLAGVLRSQFFFA